MQLFHNKLTWTIAGVAVLGGVYGLFATLSHATSSLSAWEIILPIVCGAALCGCVASALCRWVRTCKSICEYQKLQTDVVQRANFFAKSEVPTSERYEARHPSGTQKQGDSFEVWICTNVDDIGVPCRVRRQHVSRHRFQHLLNEVLKDSVLE